MPALSTFRRLPGALVLLACLASGALADDTPAKELFGAERAPAAMPTQSIGFYSKGCMAGAVGLPLDGPGWQVVNTQRNRRWGHPATVDFIERLGAAAPKLGWGGLLVGDMSQPRGGPMPSGHASHQIGLDVDIWFTPEPRGGLSPAERDPFRGASMLRKGTFQVDDRRWTPAHAAILRQAASDRRVDRIFVNPGIKRKLCETVRGDRAWLAKVRPYYGHDEHFHVRLGCQPGSPQCDGQNEIAKGDGCGELGWWFNVALQPPKPGAKPHKPKPPMTMAALPAACRAVLAAPDKGTATARVPAVPAAAAAMAPEAPAPAALDGVPRPRGSIPMPGQRPFQ